MTALLALAALSLISAPLEARTHKKTPHAVASHPAKKTPVKAEAPSKKKRSSKSSSSRASKAKTEPKASAKAKSVTKHHGHRHRSEPVEDTIPATINRVHSTGRKATASDFLQAASVPTNSSEPLHTAAPVHDPVVARTGETAAKTATHTPSAPEKPTAKPIGVVSAIRPTSERPSLSSIEEAATTNMVLPALYNKRGRLIVPPPLKGSHEILLRQNQVADRDGLDRIRDDEDILELRGQKLLVALPTNTALVVDEHLPANRRYCRPWTAQFLSTLARAYYERFRTPLQVNSAVRTVEFQHRLLRTNGNAAPAEGDTASPHLTGQAVDLAKHGLSLTQIAWLRGYLLPLVQQGKVDVEEEFQQSCFHISVYKKYLPAPYAPRHNFASNPVGETSTLATAVR
ncbi:MAG: hypothetical protein JWM43_4223 [Acidobacteriaceae bacterium]|nr:hypothetical protein [Acidobacteriaceae bacterium]